MNRKNPNCSRHAKCDCNQKDHETARRIKRNLNRLIQELEASERMIEGIDS